MKKLMIMGGLTGFLIGFGAGLINDVSWPALFLRSSVAAFAAGVLMRWWGRLWIRGLQESLARKTTDSAALRAAAVGAKK
jgi:hypothetical protein